MAEDPKIYESLGRIEAKVDQVRRSQDDTKSALFNPGGLESRIRSNEFAIGILKRETKQISGWIAGAVAVTVSGIMAFVRYLWK